MAGGWIWQKRSAALSPMGTPVGLKLHTATDGRDVLLNDPDGWEVDQPWLWWMGPAGSDGTGGPYGNPLDNNDPLGAGTIPAVTRCTSIICDTIAGLPWKVYKGEYDQLPTPDWISDPQSSRIDGRVISGATPWDTRYSPVEFWANWIVAALWWGDGYIYCPVRDNSGAPKPPLWQLHPNDVKIDKASGTYWVGNTMLPTGSIIHLRGAPPYIDGHGQGVLKANAADIALAKTVRSYAASVFTSGVPAGYLKSTQPTMSPEQAAALKAAWMKAHGNARRSIAVLNSTTEFTPISISPVDAQMALAKEWSLRDVALAFGIPPYMLGLPGDSSTYANVESRMIELRTFSLLPWIRRIESVLDSEFPRGTSVKISSDALLRADTATRYSAYETAIRAGFMTVDEVRQLEDRPPLPTTEGVT
jgi:HK97 family phage portal protein